MAALRALLLVLFPAILMLSGCNSTKQVPYTPNAPCMTIPKGQGSIEQQNCLGEHIKGFGGYYYTSSCTMVVYLTNLKKEQEARTILEPFSKAMSPECGNRMSLEIRKGQFEFSDLLKWSKASEILTFGKNTKVPGVHAGRSIPFFDNRAHISVDKDYLIPIVKQFLREHNIPIEAFNITSKESELKAKSKQLAAFSTAPEIRRIGSDEEVVVPAVRWGGEKAAELIMGETSLHEVLMILPPFPGHGPKKSSGKEEAKLDPEIKQVLDRIEQDYNPASTQTIVGFDQKKKLIFVLNTVEREQAERFAEELNNMTDMTEMYRNPKAIVKQGKLTPCVIVQTTEIVEDNNTSRVNGAAYFFTCKTKR